MGENRELKEEKTSTKHKITAESVKYAIFNFLLHYTPARVVIWIRDLFRSRNIAQQIHDKVDIAQLIPDIKQFWTPGNIKDLFENIMDRIMLKDSVTGGRITLRRALLKNSMALHFTDPDAIVAMMKATLEATMQHFDQLLAEDDALLDNPLFQALQSAQTEEKDSVIRAFHAILENRIRDLYKKPLPQGQESTVTVKKTEQVEKMLNVLDLGVNDPLRKAIPWWNPPTKIATPHQQHSTTKTIQKVSKVSSNGPNFQSRNATHEQTTDREIHPSSQVNINNSNTEVQPTEQQSSNNDTPSGNDANSSINISKNPQPSTATSSDSTPPSTNNSERRQSSVSTRTSTTERIDDERSEEENSISNTQSEVGSIGENPDPNPVDPILQTQPDIESNHNNTPSHTETDPTMNDNETKSLAKKLLSYKDRHVLTKNEKKRLEQIKKGNFGESAPEFLTALQKKCRQYVVLHLSEHFVNGAANAMKKRANMPGSAWDDMEMIAENTCSMTKKSGVFRQKSQQDQWTKFAELVPEDIKRNNPLYKALTGPVCFQDIPGSQDSPRWNVVKHDNNVMEAAQVRDLATQLGIAHLLYTEQFPELDGKTYKEMQQSIKDRVKESTRGVDMKTEAGRQAFFNNYSNNIPRTIHNANGTPLDSQSNTMIPGAS